VLNFCRMMQAQGLGVVHYGAEGSVVCCEQVDIITAEEQARYFGGHDWRRKGFALEWDATREYWRLTNNRAVREILARRGPRDLLCVIGGTCQQPIATALPDMRVCEWGIGYAGVFAPFRVWESYAWMHCVLGQGGAYQADGRFYDAVIPNSFPAEDFTPGYGEGNYALYIGRLIRRKGVEVAIEAAKAAGVKLVVAGQGGEVRDGRLWYDGVSMPADNVEYVGAVDVVRRNELMGGALAVLAPTLYVEPFGGVAVEAQMCGTPAITTDWGAFVETVQHGVTGFRCHTLGEFVWALRQAGELDRAEIRKRALHTYSLEAVAPRYAAYVARLQDLDGKGWYTIRESPEVWPR
jgi:glycosyltransferase involved in cell wall biosynthesis